MTRAAYDVCVALGLLVCVAGSVGGLVWLEHRLGDYLETRGVIDADDDP